MATASTKRCWNGGVKTIGVVALLLTALGLAIGGFKYQGAAMAEAKDTNTTEHIEICKELSDLGQRTTVVETLQPLILEELRNMGDKVDEILLQMPRRAVSSPSNER